MAPAERAGVERVLVHASRNHAYKPEEIEIEKIKK
jgi:hypothetical protein